MCRTITPLSSCTRRGSPGSGSTASNKTSSQFPDVYPRNVCIVATPGEPTNLTIRRDLLATSSERHRIRLGLTRTDVTLLTRVGQNGRRVEESPQSSTVLRLIVFLCVRPPVRGLRRVRDGAVTPST